MLKLSDKIKIIKEELKCKNYNELAYKIGVNETRIKTLASKKGSPSLAEEEIRILVEKFNFNIYWLVLGKGNTYQENDNINISEFNHEDIIKEITQLLEYAPNQYLNIIKEKLINFKKLIEDN